MWEIFLVWKYLFKLECVCFELFSTKSKCLCRINSREGEHWADFDANCIFRSLILAKYIAGVKKRHAHRHKRWCWIYAHVNWKRTSHTFCQIHIHFLYCFTTLNRFFFFSRSKMIATIREMCHFPYHAKSLFCIFLFNYANNV
jgi:hypothetical protein